MLKILLLFFFSPLLLFSQSNITDTTMIVGVVTEDCFVGKSVESYCINGVDKSLEQGTAVIVSGVLKCKKSYSNETNDFFEILHNKSTYFIEKEKLRIGKEYTYDFIANITNDEATSLRNYAQKASEVIYDGQVKKALKFLNACKPLGLSVLSWSFYDESEYTDGTSTKIKVYNPTGKTIKYMWFTFVGFNPVGDKVIDRKRGTSSIVVKAVGPIKPEESGTYEYSYVWFTDLVETAKVASIKVQYMDGTFKVIANPKSIMLDKKLYELLEEE